MLEDNSLSTHLLNHCDPARPSGPGHWLPSLWKPSPPWGNTQTNELECQEELLVVVVSMLCQHSLLWPLDFEQLTQLVQIHAASALIQLSFPAFKLIWREKRRNETKSTQMLEESEILAQKVGSKYSWSRWWSRWNWIVSPLKMKRKSSRSSFAPPAWNSSTFHSGLFGLVWTTVSDGFSACLSFQPIDSIRVYAASWCVLSVTLVLS